MSASTTTNGSRPENIGLGDVAAERLPRELVEADLNAQRRPDLDDEYFVGWELPDRTLLQVGHGSARLTAGGERFHLLAWPDRPRVWAARRMIAGLGLPADTGATFAGTAHVQDRPAGTVHSIVETHPSWAVDREGSSSIEARALATLPPLDVVEERLVLESEIGAAELLEELRRLSPPPKPPRLRVGVAEERIDFVLHADGIEEIESRHDVDGSMQERRRVLHRWEPPSGSGRPGEPLTEEGRCVAAVTAGPVSATVTAVHRSHVLDIVSPSFEGRWFLAGAPDVTLPSELAWAGFVRAQGLEADGIVSLDRDRPPADESAFASPAGADLIRRRVTRRWVRSVDVPVERRLAPGASAAAEFGLTLDQTAVIEPPPADVAGVASAMVANAVSALDLAASADSRKIVFRERLEVAETWRGAVTAEVEYLVWHGQSAWPPLADGQRVPEFVVDLTGELRHPSEARWAQLEDCASCDRKMLLGSVSCPWCSELIAVDPGEEGRLPRELLATGCALRWVPALEGRPLLIVGEERTELVRLGGLGVDEWISGQGVRDDHLLLALGARSRLDVDTDLVLRAGVRLAPDADAPVISSNGAVVHQIEELTATYRVDSGSPGSADTTGSGDIAGASIRIASGRSSLRAIVEHLDVVEQPIPTAADEIRARLLAHLADRVRSEMTSEPNQQAPASVTIDEHLTVVRVVAAPDGLRELRTKDGQTEDGAHRPWRRRGPVVWLEPSVEGSVDDDVLAWSEVADVEVVVVANSEGQFLVVRTNGGPQRMTWPSTADPVVLQ